jgi:hypothetical protein
METIGFTPRNELHFPVLIPGMGSVLNKDHVKFILWNFSKHIPQKSSIYCNWPL